MIGGVSHWLPRCVAFFRQGVDCDGGVQVDGPRRAGRRRTRVGDDNRRCDRPHVLGQRENRPVVVDGPCVGAAITRAAVRGDVWPFERLLGTNKIGTGS